MIDLIVKNCKFLLTMNSKRDLLSNASIAVDKGRIVEIGEAKKLNDKYQAKRAH